MKDDVILMPVKGSDLRAGMAVRRTPDSKERPVRLEPPKGSKPKLACEKGKHFGIGCYDRISTWWVEVKDRSRAVGEAMDAGYGLSPDVYEDLIKRGPFT